MTRLIGSGAMTRLSDSVLHCFDKALYCTSKLEYALRYSS